MILHIMVGQNPNKLNSKEDTLYNLIWCDVRVYLCQKIYVTSYKKMWIYSKNDRNDF
jgi:hypothetical protein